MPYDPQPGRTPVPARSPLGQLRERILHDTGGNRGASLGERLRLEAQSLMAWAAANGAEADADYEATAEEIPGGNEHRVFLLREENRVLKLTNPPNFGAQGGLLNYLNNIVLSNLLWGDDIRLEAARATPAGPELIISQPFIRGRDATEEEIRTYFEVRGFFFCGYHSFQQPSGLADCRCAISQHQNRRTHRSVYAN
jgi:Serine/Threonine/Tyrosine Kinase found in polyvalent proteins